MHPLNLRHGTSVYTPERRSALQKAGVFNSMEIDSEAEKQAYEEKKIMQGG
jgi:hypothetical protein